MRVVLGVDMALPEPWRACPVRRTIAAMLWWRALVLVVLVGGCVDSGVVDCGNGIVCPVGRVCAHVEAPDENLCVDQGQITACEGRADGDMCTFGAALSACASGVCLPIECGNSRVEPGEVCDDGNTVTGDGTCSSDCQSDERCGNGEVDPLALVNGERETNEQCDDGNLLSGDGCSSTCRTETTRWVQLGGAPEASEGVGMVYDPDHHRMVLFGGRTATSIGDVYIDATHEWDGRTIARIPTVGSPPPRGDHAMAYDAAHHRVVMFGGRAGDDDSPFGDTWTFDGTRWERQQPATSPLARSSAGMVYDAKAKRIVMFGGYTRGTYYDDTWTWDGATWTKLTVATSPPGRAHPLMAFDPKRAVIVMGGGIDENQPDGFESLRDIWELSGSTWVKTATSTPVELDSDCGAAYDTPNGRVIAFGGKARDIAAIPSEATYAYTGAGWTQLTTAVTPGKRRNMAMAGDPNTGEILLFGGQSDTGQLLAAPFRWTGSAWTDASFVPFAYASSQPAGAYDPQHGKVWLFGGLDATDTATSALVSFDGLSWRTHVPSSGPTPEARSTAGLAFDRARNELVLFGGADHNTQLPNTTWRWNGTTWTSSTPSPSPSARFAPGMTYDPRRKVVVLFGGVEGSGTPLGDTWEWDGTSWKQIATATSPAPRAAASLVYDEARGQVVMYSGLELPAAGLPESSNDLWTYDGTNWTLASDPVPASDRFLSQLGYDPHAHVSTVFGGFTFGGGYLADTWTWNGTAWSDQQLTIHPPARGQHVTVSSPDGIGVIIAGGAYDDAPGALNTDIWQLAYENTQPREICDVVTDNDGDGLQGCEDPDCWMRCTPSCQPGTPAASCDSTAPHCGDGVCNADVENCRICAQDCQCTAACGDTFCDGGETATCPGDCP